MTDPNPFAGKSDDELMALEQDRTLPIDQWMAVEAERGRRASARAAEAGAGGGRGAGNGPASAPSSRPAPAGAAGEDARIQAALAQIRALLVPGEALQAYAVQRRLFALVHRRVVVAATTGRFVSLTRGLFGGYALFDVRWQDLQDASVRAGIFGATLTIASMTTEDMASGAHTAGHPGARYGFVGLRKPQAEQVYALCQAQEQVWREKRRVRDLDELRAQSGGVQIGAGAAGLGSSAPGGAGGDPMERLRRAKEMLDGGLISDTEYESIKARVVDFL